MNPSYGWASSRAAVGLRLGMTAVYHGDPSAGLDWLKKAMRLDPIFPESRFEILFDAHYLSGQYEAAVNVFRRWRNPPTHMYAEYAAALAQIDDRVTAAAATKIFNNSRSKKADISAFVNQHTRMCRYQKDRDHWLDEYRKAGFSV